MGKQKYVERNGRMCVSYKEKDGDKTVTKVRGASNFVFEPVAQVVGSKSGYLMEVTIFNGSGERYVQSNGL